MIEVEPSDQHCKMQEELINLLERFAPDVTDIAALAIASNLVGKVLALQDHSKHTQVELMATIARNVRAGHAEAIAVFMGAGQPRN